MGIFNIFKKNKKENDKMSTLEEIRKAYEDLSDEDKKSFTQSISDRVHESVAAQERASGTEDSQSAEAREHEALGAEHADGKGEVEELHEKVDTAEEKAEDAREKAQEEKTEDHGKAIEELKTMFEARLKKLEDAMAQMAVNKLDSAREKYGLSSKGGTETPKNTFTDEDVNKLLG